MARQKGSAKTGGRKKGTPNKISGTIKDWISNLIDNNRKQVEADLKQIKPVERLLFLEKLLGFVVPKQQNISTKIDFDNMTESQLDAIIEKLTKEN